MGWVPEGNRSLPERVGLVDEAESWMELTSMPLVTGELWLLPGIDRRSVQAGRSTDRGSASVFSPSLPEKDGCGPAALAPDSPFSGERLGSGGDWRWQFLWMESQPKSEGPVHDALIGPRIDKGG